MRSAASSMAAPAPLMDELVEEILLRTPPDDPARLLHAALVCKRWCRIVSDPGFRRRFREFHRTAPMLGFLCSCKPWTSFGASTSFVSTTSFRPSRARARVNYYETVDSRHGRVLLHAASWNHERELWEDNFVVWDPIAGGEPTTTRLPLLPRSRYQQQQSRPTSITWNAAVLCASSSAASAAADACDHLECHGGPFLVVFVTRGRRWGRHGMCAHVYSSESAAWSGRIYARLVEDMQQSVPSALAGNSLYFLCRQSVLKFDLSTRVMSLIDLPLPQGTFERPVPMLRATEDDGLGLVTMGSDGLHLWSREVGPDEDVVWVQSKVIKPVIPDEPLGSPRLTGFAHGLDAILVRTSEGIFTVDLKSVRVTKVCKESWSGGGFTFPYVSFYTPALGVSASAE